MENEVYNEEIVLSDDASTEDNISSDQTDTLEDKLDHIEALLNEDITLRSQDEETVENVQGDDEQGTDIYTTTSGNDVNVGTPNYNQYIYDLLTDSTIKVEVVGEKGIFEKQLNDYNVTESIGVIALFIAFGFIVGVFVNKFTFKRR